MLKEEFKKELSDRIIPFWNSLKDSECGGFFGYADNSLSIDKKADKGCILMSRILWFYSACYAFSGGEENLSNASHAYDFIRNFCIDAEYGGVFWMMTYDGKVSDGMKHTYNQAFAVYALSAYHLASQSGEALELALSLFDLIEEKCASSIGYIEAFTRDWKPAANDALSENGIIAEKTMNTVLHLIEAYTVLYQASGDIRVKNRLLFLLDITYKKILDKENDKLFVFFDKDMNVLGDIHSYGHDIEASWLIDRACEAIGDAELISRWKEISLKIAENIFNVAYENGAVNYEHDRGNNEEINKKRVWWVQAESVVGFLNAYRNSGDEKFLKAAGMVWEYIKKYQIDKRKGSEWFAETAFDGSQLDTCELAGPWKCPYHNGRMCIEAARILK